MKIAAVLVTLLALACGSAQAETIITLAADPWCPHTCAALGGKPGTMVEIATRAFAARGITVRYKTMAWARAMVEVRAGKIDGAVGALAGEAGDLVLHAEPLGRQTNAFIARANDAWRFAGLASLEGKRIGTIQDYSYAPDIDAWLAKHAGIVHPLGGENALVRNLRKLTGGRLDVVVEDESVLAHHLKQLRPAPEIQVAGRIAGGNLFIALRQGGDSARYADILDQGIRDLRASGELQRIMAAYGGKDWKD